MITLAKSTDTMITSATPAGTLVEHTPYGPGVSLDKDSSDDWKAHASADLSLSLRHMARRQPWYPLVGHRAGLRANDLVTLASALWIEANER